MNIRIISLVCTLALYLCAPPPPAPPNPVYQVHLIPPKIVEGKDNPKFLKRLAAENSITILNAKVKISISENENTEEHAVNITSSGSNDNYYFTSYLFTFQNSDDETYEILSNSCNKVYSPLSNPNLDCSSKYTKENNQYKINYNFKLHNKEIITLKYKIKKSKTNKEKLYIQRYLIISNLYAGGDCDYTFTLENKFINLGLRDAKGDDLNIFTKKSDKIYSYRGKCPSEEKQNLLRFSHGKTTWESDTTLYIESQSQITGINWLDFPRYYKGGKIRNTNYILKTTEGKTINENEYINNHTRLKIELQPNNKNKIGVNLKSSFSNNLKDEFQIYFPDTYNSMEQNIDKDIKDKALELASSGTTLEKAIKIGQFVYSYMTYDINEYDKTYTAKQIYTRKKGVCEHFTLLFNTMLNAIGIKALTVFGWAFHDEKTSSDENEVGHAWTAALIDGKWKEFDSTWGLFQGIPAGHVLQGFFMNDFSNTGPSKVNLDLKSKIELKDISDYESNQQADETKENPQDDTTKSTDKENESDEDDEPQDFRNGGHSGSGEKFSILIISIFLLLIL